MKYLYQPTLIPGVMRAVTLNYVDDATPPNSITMFNASMVVAQAQDGSYSAAISRVDGNGTVLKDSSGDLTATGNGATEDAAACVAMSSLAARVIPAPSVTSITPSTSPAAGGTSVTICGSNFIGVTGVTIGGVAATDLKIVDPTHVTITTPAGPDGQADVVVTGPLAVTTAAKAFTYQ